MFNTDIDRTVSFVNWSYFTVDQVKLCTFNCSLANGVGSVIVQFCREKIQGDDKNDKDKDQINDDSVNDNNGHATRAPPSDGDSRTTRRKQSIKRTAVSSFSHAVSPNTLHRGRWASLVGSMCYVADTLWIGRRCGDIVVVNVTPNNAYEYKFGEVVAMLCSEYMPGYGSGRIERLLAVGGDRVLSFRAVDADECGGRGGEAGVGGEDEVSRVEVWEAGGLDRLHRLKTLVNSHRGVDGPLDATIL